MMPTASSRSRSRSFRRVGRPMSNPEVGCALAFEEAVDDADDDAEDADDPDDPDEGWWPLVAE